MIDIRYATESDFDYIYELSSKNSDLLGYVHPMEIRTSIAAEKTIVPIVDGNIAGFCMINLPTTKKAESKLTVQIICVDPEYRGKGLARKMLDFLVKTYQRHIFTTCVKGTSSDAFWSKVAVKYDEDPGKKRAICRYKIEIKRPGQLID